MRVFLLIGVLLLANGAWLYPGNVRYEHRYAYEAERVDYPPDGDYRATVRNCDWHPLQSRECAIVRALARNRTLRLDLRTDVSDELVGDEAFYDTLDGFHRPASHVENGTLVVGMEPVGREAVMRAAAENYSDAPDPVRAAVRTGTVTTTEEIPERYRFVGRNGTYYRLDYVDNERYPTGWGWKDPSPAALGAMRWLGWLAGLAAVWYAGVLFGWDRWGR